MHNKPHTEETRRRISEKKKGVPNMNSRRKMKIVEGVEHYQCRKCRDFYPREGFYASKTTLIGMQSICKICDNKKRLNSLKKKKP